MTAMRAVILLAFAVSAEAMKALKGARLFSNATNRTMMPPITRDISDLEVTVHELLAQDATPSLANFAKELEKIIEDDMMAAVKKVRSSLQTELDGHYATGYNQCDTTMLGSSEVSTKSSTFEAAASQHSTCRKEEGEAATANSNCEKEEADLKAEKEKKCKVVADNDAISNGNCAKQSGETYVTYTRRLKEFYAAEEKKGLEAEAECKKATDAYDGKAKVCADLKSKWTTKKTACDSQQDTMDAAACTILSTSQSVCKEYDDCYTAATTSYNNDKSSVQTQEAAIKNEWKALLHLKCLLDVFTKSDQQKSAAITTCNNMNYDSQAAAEVSLTYPSPVPREKKTCSEASASTVAGRDEYKAKYYNLPSNAPEKTCEADCCATCDSFQCPDGYAQVDDPSKVFGEMRDVCCTPTFLPGSKLLQTAWEDRTLKSFLPSRFGNSDRTHWTLCYRWTTRQHIDHWDNTCGHKYNTLTIVKMSSGKKMGGFASARFQGNNQYVRDTQAFLFSLTSGHKHGLTGSSNDQYALYDAAGSFPRWGGGHDFYIYNNEARSGANGYSNIGHTYSCRVGSYGSNTCRTDFTGDYNFMVEEMETYYHSR